MRKAISCLGLILFVVIVLAGCGGSISSTPTPLGTNMAQVSLTIHDNPPMGVTVLSFEIEVTGATLQPSGPSSSQPVSMLSEPECPNGNLQRPHCHVCKPSNDYPKPDWSDAHPRNANLLRSTSV